MATEKKKAKDEDGYLIFRAWVIRADGKRDYARDHGLKAWPIWVTSSSSGNGDS